MIRIFSFLLLVGLGYRPSAFVHTNAMLDFNRNRCDYKFSDKNYTVSRRSFLFILGIFAFGIIRASVKYKTLLLFAPKTQIALGRPPIP